MDSRTCPGVALAALVIASPCLSEESKGDKPPLLPERVAEVLRWLPPDTETVFVAQGPFGIPAIPTGQKPAQSIEEPLQLLGLGPLTNLKDGEFLEPLLGHQVALCVEGSRRFRAPKGLGMMPYEGCHVVIFEKELGKDGEALAASLKSSASKTGELEGHTTYLFEVKSEADTWHAQVVLPRPDIVLSATNTEYMRETLARMKKPEETRALPADLPEWKHADTQARFWAVRHYDPKEAGLNRASPFHERSVFLSDKDAVGVTFAYDPKGKKATLVHLTGNKSAMDILSRFWQAERNQLKPEMEAHAGRVKVSIEVKPGNANLFLFVLLGVLGHCIFI